MESRFKFNKTSVEKAQPVEGKQVVYWDDQLVGFGLRVSPGGAKTFFFQYRIKGRAKKITVGRFGPWTVEQARKEVKRLAGIAATGKDPATPKGESEASTFGDMLEGYCDLMDQQGKHSARSVRNAIDAGVRKAFPRLWKRPVNEITLDDCVKIVGRLVDSDKLRQADKLRSYISTAFTKAINARGDAKAPKKLRAVNVKTNPARDMSVVEGSGNARQRALSLNEFRNYWQRVQQQPEPARSLLMMHVLTGGQRPQQLARVTFDDIDRDQGAMVLLDYKGKRTKPRLHHVPLLPECIKMIDAISSGPFVFSATGGKTPIGEAYLLDRVKMVVADMDAAGELEKGPFTAGTIRATIETRLAKAPYYVPKEIRAQLQSHGLGGVQDRHYLHDEFHDEKVAALVKLKQLLMDEEVAA